jgi:ATP-dependent protease HslVU (ClpYQ) peptidase subunit
VTTIACDGRSMAGDGSRESKGTVVTLRAKKIRKLSDGRLAGTAGLVCDGEALLEWLEKGGKYPKHGESRLLVLNTDGSLHLYADGSNGVPVEVDAPAALGSGCDLALGAMLAGATAKEAVGIAIDRDPGSGGTITVLHLNEGLAE